MLTCCVTSVLYQIHIQNLQIGATAKRLQQLSRERRPSCTNGINYLTQIFEEPVSHEVPS